MKAGAPRIDVEVKSLRSAISSRCSAVDVAHCTKSHAAPLCFESALMLSPLVKKSCAARVYRGGTAKPILSATRDFLGSTMSAARSDVSYVIAATP